MLDVCAGEGCGPLPPNVRRQIEIFGANQIADSAALMSFLDTSPEAVEFLLELIGLVEQNCGARDQIEDSAVGSGDRGIKLPSGKDVDSTGADGGFDNRFVPGNALAAQAGVNGA